MKKVILFSFCLALFGCGSYGDKYDGLLVADGDGNIYTLKHRLLDVYFVTKMEKDNGIHAEANKNLLEITAGKEQ